MRVIIVDHADEVAKIAAERIAAVVRAGGSRARSDAVDAGSAAGMSGTAGGVDSGPAQQGAVLGVATGSSPLGIYRELASLARGGQLDLSNVRAFALDEYVGLDPAHPESYHSVIRRTVTEPLGLAPERVRVPDGAASDLSAACIEYERAIVAAGGVDLQVLGIGSNGHIGFNEPSSSFASRTRVKTLAEQTRKDNQRFFGSLEEVPTHCVTQGLGTIMDARQLLMVAQGASKAEAVARMVEGPLASVCPASILQMHRFATVVLDRPAAALLEYGAYYEHVERHAGAFDG